MFDKYKNIIVPKLLEHMTVIRGTKLYIFNGDIGSSKIDIFTYSFMFYARATLLVDVGLVF